MARAAARFRKGGEAVFRVVRGRADLFVFVVTVSLRRFRPTIYTMCDIGDSCIMSLIMRAVGPKAVADS